MVYPPELLDRLQAITPTPWSGQAFRHMFGDYPPDAENTRGARWNPQGVAAIYTSLTRDGAAPTNPNSPAGRITPPSA